jgi:hypothetical protein
MNKYYVEKVTARYFIVSERKFKHLHGCKIVTGTYCNCGLIYDLSLLDLPFSAILYPDFYKEYKLTEKKPILRGRNLWLKNTFGTKNRAKLRDIKATYEEFKEMMKYLFPRKTDCPDVYKRLDEWMQKEVSKKDDLPDVAILPVVRS